MEHELIRWLENRFAGSANARNTEHTDHVLLGIGDDGAVLAGSKSKQVLVADAIVDHVHFDSSKDDLRQVGHKAIAVNLSDIAAMGAVPVAALVSLILPRAFTLERTKELFTGLAASAEKYHVAIVGGDTCIHDGPLMVSVSLTGRIEEHAKAPEGWRIDGAKPADRLVVTGPLGGSILGSHLEFEPRLDISAAIQEQVLIHAATDISDSLLVDLSHMMRKSKAGALLNMENVPVAAAANELSSKSGKSALEHALQDGEDFELLLSMPENAFNTLQKDAVLGPTLFAIGKVVADHAGEIVDVRTGAVIEPHGYEHI